MPRSFTSITLQPTPDTRRYPSGGIRRYRTARHGTYGNTALKDETSSPRRTSNSSHAARKDALLRQQTALAQFGELALKTEDLDAILQEGCQLVGEALGTDLAKIITLEDRGTQLFVRAGVGWPPGIVGHLKFDLSEDSSDRFALEKGEPVVIPDIGEENRFKVAPFVLQQGVQAFVNVPIIGADSRPKFGILEVDSRSPRAFTSDDISFLRTHANMIAAAVERHRNLAEVRSLATQREQLLAELQHRLKNNLQSVSSLIGIESARASTDETKNLLHGLLARIDSLRLVHENIYASGKFDAVDLALYLRELSASLLRFHDRDDLKIHLVTDLRPLAVSPDIAIPLGMIVTEFITNSVKHAFDREGTIAIRLNRPRSAEALLVISDDGKGLGPEESTGTGMRLIAGLSRQVNGKPQWTTEHGTKLTLTFSVGSPE